MSKENSNTPAVDDPQEVVQNQGPENCQQACETSQKEYKQQIKNLFRFLSFYRKTPHLDASNQLEYSRVAQEMNILNYKMGQYLSNTANTQFNFKILFKRYWYRLLMIILAAFIFNFGIQIFVVRGDTVPSGFSGIPTLLQIFFPIVQKYFALIYIGINLPLFLIFWGKIKWSFLILTLFFMVVQISANFIFTDEKISLFLMKSIAFTTDELTLNDLQSFIRYQSEITNGENVEHIKNLLGTAQTTNDLKILANYLTLNDLQNFVQHQISNSQAQSVEHLQQLLKQYQNEPNGLIQILSHLNSEELNQFVQYQTFVAAPEGIGSINNSLISAQNQIESLRLKKVLNNLTNHEWVSLMKFKWYSTGNSWSFLVNSFIGSFVIGTSIAITWKAGGSTGGTDIIAYYFIAKSKKSIGKVLSLFSFTSSIIFLIIWGFVKPNYSPDWKETRIIFGVRELSTFCYILISSTVINLIYPKYKKVKLTIVSSDINQVVAYFKLINYWHAYQIIKFTSGFTGKESYKIETVVLLFETKNIIYDLKLIQPNIWISINPVYNIIGKFDTKFVDD